MISEDQLPSTWGQVDGKPFGQNQRLAEAQAPVIDLAKAIVAEEQGSNEWWRLYRVFGETVRALEEVEANGSS